MALGEEEREAHRAADQHDVGPVQERVEHPELVGDLRAADDGDQGAGGVAQDAAQRLDLALQQQPGRARQPGGDAVVGGVGAVRRPEGVVDVDVPERGVARRQLRAVLRLAGEEADVLDHDHGRLGQRRVGLGHERHVHAEQLAHAGGDGRQREARVGALGPAEVGEEHELGGAALPQRPQRRKRRPDPRVVGDRDGRPGLERDVEVDAHDDAPPRHVEVVQPPHEAGSTRSTRSMMRLEYPHSLSYQETTFTSVPSMTLVSCPSTIDEWGSFWMSVETIGSSV